MNYSIAKATKAQMDFISERYWSKSPKWQQNRYNFIAFVACDSQNNIIGYLVCEEKEIPIMPYGKDWFIETIMVLKPYRCCGIGSALLDHAFSAAREQEIRNFQGSANPTKEAHAFWAKNKFTFFQYGRQHNDPSREEECGNYSHIIFKQVSKIDFYSLNRKTGRYNFNMADREQIDDIFFSYIEKECVKFYHDKKDQIKGIIASNADGEELGFITWLEMPLMPPLIGKQWYIPYVYVKPESRGNGLARELTAEVMTRAIENSITQLLMVHTNEDIMPYWYKLGFDIFIYRYLFRNPSGKFPVGIGKNLTGYDKRI